MEERNIMMTSVNEFGEDSAASFNSDNTESLLKPNWNLEKTIESWDSEEGLGNFFVPSTMTNAKLIYKKE